MTSEVSAKELDDNNSIIESEILEQEDEDEDAEEKYSTSHGTTISEQVVINEVVVAQKKLNENSELSENYSEEFENDEELEESVKEEEHNEYSEEDYEEEEEEDEQLEGITAASSSGLKSSSSSRSIRIRCEINISNSAVKSDPVQEEQEKDEDEERTTIAGSSRRSSRSSHKISEQSNKFTMEEEVQSWTPSDYNEESHLFDMAILRESMVNLLLMEDRKKQHQQRMKYKNGTRMSLSFTNERMREIERHNQILVRKIFHQSASPQVTVGILF